jgi:hypothetical protein
MVCLVVALGAFVVLGQVLPADTPYPSWLPTVMIILVVGIALSLIVAYWDGEGGGG